MGRYEYEKKKFREEKELLRKTHKEIKKKLAPYRKANYRTPTEAEYVFRRALKRNQFDHTFQVPFFDTEFRCIVDFLIKWHNPRVVVEIDGGYHTTPEQQVKDKYREDWLYHKRGCYMIRFTNEEVLQNVNKCIDRLRAFRAEAKFKHRVLNKGRRGGEDLRFCEVPLPPKYVRFKNTDIDAKKEKIDISPAKSKNELTSKMEIYLATIGVKSYGDIRVTFMKTLNEKYGDDIGLTVWRVYQSRKYPFFAPDIRSTPKPIKERRLRPVGESAKPKKLKLGPLDKVVSIKKPKLCLQE